MKKVLILSYWYPPRNVIGAVRITKFAKFLPEFGWEPVVVTVDPMTDQYTKNGELRDERNAGNIYRVRDWSLNEIAYKLIHKLRPNGGEKPHSQPEAEPRRSGGFSLGAALANFYRRVVCYPDAVMLWRFFGASAVDKIIKKERPDVIFSSSLPNTVHIIASKLSKKHSIPWVADFRDLWTQNPYVERASFLRSFEERLERKTLASASALITISEGLKQDLAARYPQEVHVIPNGFDSDDLSASGKSGSNSHAGNRKFTITFTGTIYPGKRDPSALFEAMQMLIEKEKLSLDELEIHFYGRKQEFVGGLLRDRFSDLNGCVHLHGEVSREQAISAQERSTVLLLLEWIDPKAHGVYTGKIFEYLAAGKPILSIGPPGGALEQLISSTKSGFQETEPQELSKILLDWLEQFRSKGDLEFCPDKDEINKYSRRVQTEYLAEILDKVSDVTEK